MKLIMYLTIILITLATCTSPRYSSGRQYDVVQSPGIVSFQLFYDELHPYGQWVDYNRYGYVWVPDVRGDFMPYSTNGRWVLTDYGWTWLSGYRWGWATFHYGRWGYDNMFGWFWVPGNEWGPAWVNWRQVNGYYGWSPMQPGMNINASFNRRYDYRNDYWVFVRDRDLTRSNIQNYYVSHNEQDRLLRSSSVIRNTHTDRDRRTTYVTGPRRADVQRVTGRTIQPVRIQENSRPGQDLKNDRLQIYRPRVESSTGRGQQPAPRRVTNMDEIQRQPERRDGTTPRRVGTPDDSRRRHQDEINRQSLPNEQNRRTAPARQPSDDNRQVEPTRRTAPDNNDRRNPDQGSTPDNQPIRRIIDESGPAALSGQHAPAAESPQDNITHQQKNDASMQNPQEQNRHSTIQNRQGIELPQDNTKTEIPEVETKLPDTLDINPEIDAKNQQPVKSPTQVNSGTQKKDSNVNKLKPKAGPNRPSAAPKNTAPETQDVKPDKR